MPFANLERTYDFAEAIEKMHSVEHICGGSDMTQIEAWLFVISNTLSTWVFFNTF